MIHTLSGHAGRGDFGALCLIAQSRDKSTDLAAEEDPSVLKGGL
ncbi:hypothetical protein [Neptunicoccus sediminis]|nr:hypothetical protein [Neptunicoccus sediminis]